MTFAYVMNRMVAAPFGDPRNFARLVEATRVALRSPKRSILQALA